MWATIFATGILLAVSPAPAGAVYSMINAAKNLMMTLSPGQDLTVTPTMSLQDVCQGFVQKEQRLSDGLSDTVPKAFGYLAHIRNPLIKMQPNRRRQPIYSFVGLRPSRISLVKDQTQMRCLVKKLRDPAISDPWNQPNTMLTDPTLLNEKAIGDYFDAMPGRVKTLRNSFGLDKHHIAFPGLPQPSFMGFSLPGLFGQSQISPLPPALKTKLEKLLNPCDFCVTLDVHTVLLEILKHYRPILKPYSWLEAMRRVSTAEPMVGSIINRIAWGPLSPDGPPHYLLTPLLMELAKPAPLGAYVTKASPAAASGPFSAMNLQPVSPAINSQHASTVMNSQPILSTSSMGASYQTPTSGQGATAPTTWMSSVAHLLRPHTTPAILNKLASTVRTRDELVAALESLVRKHILSFQEANTMLSAVSGITANASTASGSGPPSVTSSAPQPASQTNNMGMSSQTGTPSQGSAGQAPSWMASVIHLIQPYTSQPVLEKLAATVRTRDEFLAAVRSLVQRNIITVSVANAMLNAVYGPTANASPATGSGQSTATSSAPQPASQTNNMGMSSQTGTPSQGSAATSASAAVDASLSRLNLGSMMETMAIWMQPPASVQATLGNGGASVMQAQPTTTTIPTSAGGFNMGTTPSVTATNQGAAAGGSTPGFDVSSMWDMIAGIAQQSQSAQANTGTNGGASVMGTQPSNTNPTSAGYTGTGGYNTATTTYPGASGVASNAASQAATSVGINLDQIMQGVQFLKAAAANSGGAAGYTGTGGYITATTAYPGASGSAASTGFNLGTFFDGLRALKTAAAAGAGPTGITANVSPAAGTNTGFGAFDPFSQFGSMFPTAG